MLARVPCVGTVGATAGSFWRVGMNAGLEYLTHPTLVKRIEAACLRSNTAEYRIYSVDHWNTGKNSYYLEAISVWTTKVVEGRTQTTTMEITPHRCFSLGSWGKWWNYDNQMVVSALNFMTPNVYPFDDKPVVPGIWEKIVESKGAYEWEKEFGLLYATGIQKQLEYLKRRQKMYMD